MLKVQFGFVVRTIWWLRAKWYQSSLTIWVIWHEVKWEKVNRDLIVEIIQTLAHLLSCVRVEWVWERGMHQLERPPDILTYSAWKTCLAWNGVASATAIHALHCLPWPSWLIHCSFVLQTSVSQSFMYYTEAVAHWLLHCTANPLEAASVGLTTGQGRMKGLTVPPRWPLLMNISAFLTFMCRAHTIPFNVTKTQQWAKLLIFNMWKDWKGEGVSKCYINLVKAISGSVCCLPGCKVTLNGTSGQIHSPGFCPTGGQYGAFQRCTYDVTVPGGVPVRVRFDSMKVHESDVVMVSEAASV